MSFMMREHKFANLWSLMIVFAIVLHTFQSHEFFAEGFAIGLLNWMDLPV
jgi:hypothetical protein